MPEAGTFWIDAAFWVIIAVWSALVIRHYKGKWNRRLDDDANERTDGPPPPEPHRRHYKPGMIWDTALPIGVDDAVAAARAYAMAHSPDAWRDGDVDVECGVKGGQYCWIICSGDALLPGDPDWFWSYDGFTDYFVSAWTGRCIGRRGYPAGGDQFLPGEDLRDRRSRPRLPEAPARGIADDAAR